MRKNYITYQESGSFVRFLIDVYGIEKMKEFIANFDQSGDLDRQSHKIYQLTIDDLEKSWTDYIKKIELPRIGFSVPEKATVVFGMTDPRNDDKGDGDYLYPSNKNYKKGCFDLTNFQVLKDKNNVYFRIGLFHVIQPVSYRPGISKFIPTTVIAINKGDKNKRQLYKTTNEITLADGYDIKINVGFGINMSDNLGKIFMSTPDFYHNMADFKSNTLTFSLPIELIGEPEEKWRYFVGIGLADEPSFNFSGLSPVLKNIPVLIRGGNYDHSNPAFIDILLPELVDQAAMLSGYDPEKGKRATIKMVSKN